MSQDNIGFDDKSDLPQAPEVDFDFDSLTSDESDADVVQEGTVLVATRRGYKFVLPSGDDSDDFVIGAEPVAVPEEVVDELIKRSNGRVRRVTPATTEDEEV